MDSGPGRRQRLSFAVLHPGLSRQGHHGMAVSLSTSGRSSPASGAPSEMRLVLSSYWKRSIPHAQTNLFPWGGFPSTPCWLP